MLTWTMNWIDTTVLILYLVGITAYGIWVGYRRDASSEQYFLANKSLGWFTIGSAVFTSNISTIHLVGLAASGAKDGMVVGNFEWMACFTLMLLGLVFAPFYIRSKVSTLPEFMERRYCPEARTFMAYIGLLGALLIHIGISLFAAAKLFESFLGVPMLLTIIVLSVFTVAYTAMGGLKGVVMTENIQVCLLIGGAILITVKGIQALTGLGIDSMEAFYGAVRPGQMSMILPIHNASTGHLNEFSWLGIVLGFPILGIWYWCADQTHVQRVLAAKDLKSAQNGALFAGFLKLSPVFLMVLPGVIGSILWKKGVIQLASIPGGGGTDYNTMLPALINHLVPVGLRGLLAACMAAALMSCMAAALNSCATLISLDIVKRKAPDLADWKVVRIGRITTGLIMLLAMLWSTQGDQFGTIFEAINKIPMTFAPAVTTVFLFGVLWKRGTARAAMATLHWGTVLGIVYFIADMPFVGRLFASATTPEFGGLVSDPVQGLGVPFMLAGPILAVFCVVLYVAVSLATPPMDAEAVAKVCWDHPLAFLHGSLTGLSDPRIVAGVLLAIVVSLYWTFR